MATRHLDSASRLIATASRLIDRGSLARACDLLESIAADFQLDRTDSTKLAQLGLRLAAFAEARSSAHRRGLLRSLPAPCPVLPFRSRAAWVAATARPRAASAALLTSS